MSERLEAGVFEPIFTSLEDSLSLYGDNPVTNGIIGDSGYEVFLSDQEFISEKLSEEADSTVEAIWDLFRTNTLLCDKLSLLTRGTESEWASEYEELRRRGNDGYPLDRLVNRIKKIINQENGQIAA